jgi:hypothetical protein
VIYYCDCFNHTASRELDWRCRLEVLTGVTQDISVFRFVFWQLVWFWDPKIRFPAHQWRIGRFLGRPKNVGDPFTYWVKPLHQEHNSLEPKVLARSVISSCADESEAPPGPNDYVDLPVADLLFPTIPSPKESLETIDEALEEEDDDFIESASPEQADVDVEQAATAINEQDLENIIKPPENIGKDDSSVGCVETVDPFEDDEDETIAGVLKTAKTPPAKAQDDADDDASFDDSPEGAAAAADVINNTFGYLRDADGSLCEFVEILSHRGKDLNSLEFELRWSNGQTTFAPLRLVCQGQTYSYEYICPQLSTFLWGY